MNPPSHPSRILVTGHLGYIGTVLTPLLVRRGHDVVGLDTDLFRRCTYGSESRILPVPSIERDIRDADREDLRGFDTVIQMLQAQPRSAKTVTLHFGRKSVGRSHL